MSNKDFLSQFSGSNKKPDSFKEEERIKITKERKPVNVKLIVIILAIVLAITGLVLFFVLRPTIEVRDFVGSNSSEVKAWIKQNDIEAQGIIFREEYSFDYDEGYITYQSIEAGKKVRKNAKMDFTVSLGADPEELVSVPDIMSMYKEELQDWVKENKLTKTKIMSAFSDEVESGAVISYEFKNGADVDSFKRSSTLNITVSKGPQPAGTVTVEDFVKQDYSIVESWGKKNKVEIVKTTKYDDKIAKDLVISQSIEAKKTIKEGESLTVVVSLGKGVVVPNFSTMSNDDVDEWIKENSAYCKVKEMYSYSDSYVIEQSLKSGSYIGEDSKLHLTLNLGKVFFLDELSSLGVNLSAGASYEKAKSIAENLEEYGLIIDTHRVGVPSEQPYGTIIEVDHIEDEDGKKYSTQQALPLECHIYVTISNGKGDERIKFDYSQFEGETLSYLDDWLKENYGSEVHLDVVNNPPKTEYDICIVETIKYKEKDEDEYKDIRLSDGYLKEETTLQVVVKKN